MSSEYDLLTVQKSIEALEKEIERLAILVQKEISGLESRLVKIENALRDNQQPLSTKE